MCREVEDPLGARRRDRACDGVAVGEVELHDRGVPSSSASRQQSEPGPVRSVVSYPSSSSRRATFAPMKPAAPVTRTRFTVASP